MPPLILEVKPFPHSSRCVLLPPRWGEVPLKPLRGGAGACPPVPVRAAQVCWRGYGGTSAPSFAPAASQGVCFPLVVSPSVQAARVAVSSVSLMPPLTGSPPAVKGAMRDSQMETPALRRLELDPTQPCQHLVIPVVLTLGRGVRLLDRALVGRCLGKWLGVWCQHPARVLPEQSRVARRFWTTNKQSAPFSLFEGRWGPQGFEGQLWHNQQHYGSLDSNGAGPSPSQFSTQAATGRTGFLACPVEAHRFCSDDQLPPKHPLSPGPWGCSNHKWL